MSVDKKTPYTPLPGTESAPPSYEATAEGVVLTPYDRFMECAAQTVQFAQPTSVAQMSIGGARNPKGLEVGLDGRRSWNHPLCSWYEVPGQALGATLCPCFVYSANRSRLTELTKSGQPIDKPQHVGLFCALYTISPQFFGVGQVLMQCFSRLQTRQRYNIRGDVVQDALIAGFCVPCSLIQESREIEEEEMALRQEGGAAPEVFYSDELPAAQLV